MAEYYPLLSRAVAGLRDGAPEARQAIYGRARQALIGQLRGMQPPVPEDSISKEITALDEAIARLEAEMAPPPSVSDAASAAVEAALMLDLAPPAAAPPSGPSPRDLAPEAREPEAATAAAVALKPPINRPAPPASRIPPRAERPTFTPRTTLPSGGRPVRQEPPATVSEAPADTAPAQDQASSPTLPAAPTLEPPAPSLEPNADVSGRGKAPNLAIEPAADRVPSDAVEAPDAEARRRDEVVRPAMPRQSVSQPRNLRVWVVAVAALAAVVVIALTAWKLRDKPEELARVPTPAPQNEAAPGKIVERADGAAPAEEDAEAAQPVASAAVPQAATPVPAPTAGTAAQPAGQQAIPVSYKAAVLVAAPDTPEKVRTYVGTVLWRAEGTAAGQDATAATAVRADVDVPDAKLQMTLEIRKNTEAQFPASHTIDIKFTPGPDSPVGAVKQIDVPQMRREDAATGDPLVGVPVTITNNSFLVGLTREAEARNVEAMRTRGWFDIPMVLADGKPAKITFEKGASGDRILADALTAWSKTP